MKKSYIKFIVISLLCLGVVIILSVGLDIVPKITIGWSKEFVLKFNNILLNLSFSYIAGVIIYVVINYLPDQIQKRRFQPFVKRDIKKIYSLYLELINALSEKKDKVVYENIPDFQTFEKLMEKNSLFDIYPRTKGQITKANYLKTFLYLRVETLEIIKHIYFF